MSFKYFLSVCLSIKNERKYMNEFIKHYIGQGVDHFYIIDNNSDDHIEEYINNSVYKYSVTLIKDHRYMGILTENDQAKGHKQLLDENLYELIKKETEWAIIIDADEFMYGKNGHTIASYIKTLNDDIGRVYVLWNIITPNLDNEFSLENNTKRLNYDKITTLSGNIINANNFGKSLVRTSMLNDHSKLWLHKINVDGKKINNYGSVDESYYDNFNPFVYSEQNFEELNITLNHYAIRNTEDREKKERQLVIVINKIPFITGLLEMITLDDSNFVIDKNILKFKF